MAINWPKIEYVEAEDRMLDPKLDYPKQSAGNVGKYGEMRRRYLQEHHKTAYKRMLQTVKENHGEMRWDCDKQYANPFAEKILFVFTLYNAHIYIKRLNEVLRQKGDFSFDEIAQRFIEDSKFQEIKNLRNMNVHHYEYFTGGGRDRKSFEHVIRDGNSNVCTNAHWYYENGSTGNIYVGGVEIKSVIDTYFQNRDEIMEKLKCIFEGYLSRSESE